MTSARGKSAALLLGGALLMGLAAAGTRVRIERHLVVYPYHIDHLGGARYVLQFQPPAFPFLVREDSALQDTVSLSTLVIKEDGAPLGPAHAQSADIEQLGRGRYRHVAGSLLFSASDGSDPRSNGRTYPVVYQILLARSALWAALTAGAALMLAGLARLRRDRSGDT